ncbi:excalibur calcium-binding domain-containing protein [Marinobacterium sedimentorum]|uniref:excalibur calcium-binding domain-containing protein n=1 Tax=Marinobacterium sedimentorum TaxID=2927804 RepID=UPI00211499BD|nr:excalibur calcium-binding domain-containing protein [Marinobacterium sedimentorum]
MVAFAGWTFYQKPTGIAGSASSTSFGNPPAEEYRFEAESRFSCDGRQHCSQMTSREEAVFFINNCPNTKMDGDNDGVPCENDSRF